LGKGWRDTPQATAVPSDAEDNAAALRRSISPAAVEVSLIPADKEALEKAKEVYGASAEELITRIGQVEDGATLDEVEAIEAKNPKLKGGRKTVLAAIAARRQALAVPQ
jgi:hypothetical protein